MSEQRQVSSDRSRRRGNAVELDAALLPELEALKRGDTPVHQDIKVQTGNLVRIQKPKNLSIVGLPANQVGFKVVRSDEEAAANKEAPKMNPTKILRRTRRSSDINPVMRLAFPSGTTPEMVNEALKNYGMTDYRVEDLGEGVLVAVRSDLKSISGPTTEIKLNDQGLVATVARASLQSESNANLTVTHIEFDAQKFTPEEVKRWSTEKSVDGEMVEPQNSGDSYVVRRSEVPENEETRRIVLEDGVTAVIIRSDVANIPAGFIAVVNEAAYGGWGWGQLDFGAAMADTEFGEQMAEAICTLGDVMRQILFYSSLPLDIRKELALRAAAQFGDYIGIVLDSLPRQLLVATVRSANHSTEKAMTQANSGANQTPAATTAAPAEAEKPLTRSDIATMIAEAVTTALRAAPAATPAAAAAPAVVEAAKPELAGLTRADLAAAFKDAVTPLAEQITALQGTTLTRSAPEPVVAPAVVKELTPAEKVSETFRGVLGGIVHQRRKPAAA